MSDIVWQAIIAALVTIILAWMNQRTKNAVKDAGVVTQQAVANNTTTTLVSAVNTQSVLEDASANVKNVVADAVAKTTSVIIENSAGPISEEANKKLDDIVAVAKSTHVLVNSNMGIQLKLNAELSSWKAKQTNNPKDIEAAEKASQMVQEHEEKQAKADAAPDADKVKEIMKT